MKVVLLEVCSTRSEYINKDVMGEYGMVAQIGDSIFAKILEAAKKRSVNIPVFALGYLAAILKKNGHQVEYKFNAIPLGADLVIIPSSIVDYKYEVFSLMVVNPDQVSILDQNKEASFLTLVTCVPPGTYWQRLVVKAKLKLI